MKKIKSRLVYFNEENNDNNNNNNSHIYTSHQKLNISSEIDHNNTRNTRKSEKSPSPDFKNISRIPHTLLPSKQVQEYLQTQARLSQLSSSSPYGLNISLDSIDFKVNRMTPSQRQLVGQQKRTAVKQKQKQKEKQKKKLKIKTSFDQSTNYKSNGDIYYPGHSHSNNTNYNSYANNNYSRYQNFSPSSSPIHTYKPSKNNSNKNDPYNNTYTYTYSSNNNNHNNHNNDTTNYHDYQSINRIIRLQPMSVKNTNDSQKTISLFKNPNSCSFKKHSQRKESGSSLQLQLQQQQQQQVYAQFQQQLEGSHYQEENYRSSNNHNNSNINSNNKNGNGNGNGNINGNINGKTNNSNGNGNAYSKKVTAKVYEYEPLETTIKLRKFKQNNKSDSSSNLLLGQNRNNNSTNNVKANSNINTNTNVNKSPNKQKPGFYTPKRQPQTDDNSSIQQKKHQKSTKTKQKNYSNLFLIQNQHQHQHQHQPSQQQQQSYQPTKNKRQLNNNKHSNNSNYKSNSNTNNNQSYSFHSHSSTNPRKHTQQNSITIQDNNNNNNKFKNAYHYPNYHNNSNNSVNANVNVNQRLYKQNQELNIENDYLRGSIESYKELMVKHHCLMEKHEKMESEMEYLIRQLEISHHQHQHDNNNNKKDHISHQSYQSHESPYIRISQNYQDEAQNDSNSNFQQQPQQEQLSQSQIERQNTHCQQRQNQSKQNTNSNSNTNTSMLLYFAEKTNKKTHNFEDVATLDNTIDNDNQNDYNVNVNGNGKADQTKKKISIGYKIRKSIDKSENIINIKNNNKNQQSTTFAHSKQNTHKSLQEINKKLVDSLHTQIQDNHILIIQNQKLVEQQASIQAEISDWMQKITIIKDDVSKIDRLSGQFTDFKNTLNVTFKQNLRNTEKCLEELRKQLKMNVKIQKAYTFSKKQSMPTFGKISSEQHQMLQQDIRYAPFSQNNSLETSFQISQSSRSAQHQLHQNYKHIHDMRKKSQQQKYVYIAPQNQEILISESSGKYAFNDQKQKWLQTKSKQFDKSSKADSNPRSRQQSFVNIKCSGLDENFFYQHKYEHLLNKNNESGYVQHPSRANSQNHSQNSSIKINMQSSGSGQSQPLRQQQNNLCLIQKQNNIANQNLNISQQQQQLQRQHSLDKIQKQYISQLQSQADQMRSIINSITLQRDHLKKSMKGKIQAIDELQRSLKEINITMQEEHQKQKPFSLIRQEKTFRYPTDYNSSLKHTKSETNTRQKFLDNINFNINIQSQGEQNQTDRQYRKTREIVLNLIRIVRQMIDQYGQKSEQQSKSNLKSNSKSSN